MIAIHQVGASTPKYITATAKGTYSAEACASLRKLVEHVFAHRGASLTGITYTDLAEQIERMTKHGRGHGHGMGKVLGIMGHLLEDIHGDWDDWDESIPKIQCLVVQKTGPFRGLPDIGIDEFWPEYIRMNRVEKERHVQAEYQRVSEFGSRWNQVLVKLNLLPVSTTNMPTKPKGSSGESRRHRKLQEWVRDHPESVGATSDWIAFENYTLPSLDEIDVLFRSETECIAVEVKSTVSDQLPQDYERGIYQTIKYAAILRAMHTAGSQESRAKVKAVLVLESTLPEQYRQIALDLNMTIIENMKLPSASSLGVGC
jgi:hypothetical protein